MRTFYAVILLIFLSPWGAAQRSTADVTQAAEISSRLKDDVSKLLEDLVGRGKSRVFIEVKGEIISKAKSQSQTPDEDIISLPGYSAVNILEKTSKFLKKQKGEAEYVSEFRIKKINASVILDKSIEPARANAIKLLVSDVLRLDPGRGDTITLTQTEMLPWWKSFLDSPSNRRIIVISLIGAFLLTILSLLFYALASNLFKGAIDYARMSAMTSTRPIEAGGPASPGFAEGLAAPEQEGGTLPEIMEAEGADVTRLLESEKAFGFLEKFSPEEISDILSSEDPEDLAVIIAFLADSHPHVSSKLLLAFPDNIRPQITKHIIDLKQVEPERLMEIENNVRLKIERSLKGSEKLGKLLSIINADERSKIIDNLPDVDPKTLDKIKESLVTFDDICRLDAKNLRVILMGMPYQEWATALHGVSDSAKRHVVNIYPEEIRAIVKDLLSAEKERHEIISARAKIITTVLDMTAKGKVSLRNIRG